MSSHALAILGVVLAYQAVLLGVGLWARGRSRDARDFFLAGQRLGPWTAGLSAAASSSSAWVLLGISGAAYQWGLSALWLLPGAYGGFALNWLWVAPRLRRITGVEDVTLFDVLVGHGREGHALRNRRIAAAIVVFCFLFYVAAQFQAAGQAFQGALGLPPPVALALGAGIVVLYTLLGGFLAVSATDMLQGLLMLAAALLLPAIALVAAGGPQGVLEGLQATGDPALLSPTGTHLGLAGAGFVLGTLGIGLGNPGQPHVLARFMALRDMDALRRAQWIAVAWGACLYGGMVLLGLAARTLFAPAEVADSEGVFFLVANRFLPVVLGGLMVAATLSAIMSTADSQLLVCASSLSRDWPRRPAADGDLRRSRLVVLAVSACAVALTVALPQSIFARVLFAWNAVGAAFGPAIILLLLGRPVAPAWLGASMLTGFSATVLANWFVPAPGQWVERLLPFALALAVAWAGRSRTPAAPGPVREPVA
jgi:sodium/proline symporter